MAAAVAYNLCAKSCLTKYNVYDPCHVLYNCCWLRLSSHQTTLTEKTANINNNKSSKNKGKDKNSNSNNNKKYILKGQQLAACTVNLARHTHTHCLKPLKLSH